MSRTACVILAGGRGQRLGGVNKAFIEIGGQRLIDRVARVVGDCDPIVVSIGRMSPQTALLPGVRQVSDIQTDFGGPLAGVAAVIEVLDNCNCELLLTVAVDTPFFPPDFLTRAMAALGGAPAIVAAYAGQPYPTNALWRLASLRGLPDQIRNGSAPRSLKRLAEALGAARLDYSDLSPDDPFANINTAADLAAARLREGR